MKATGIVRRIDDLGRVVIPKEIRTTHGIQLGDPMEIFVDDFGICIRKFNCVENAITTLEMLGEFIFDSPGIKNKTMVIERLQAIKNLLKEG